MSENTTQPRPVDAYDAHPRSFAQDARPHLYDGSRGLPLSLGELTLHPDEHRVDRNNKPVPLRKKEYELLEFLAKNKNRVISRHTILEYVWNYNVNVMTNTLEVHVSNLRRKIGNDYASKVLHTVYGLGYKLCDSPSTPISWPASRPPRPSPRHLQSSPPLPIPPDISPPHPTADLSSPPRPCR